MLATCNKSFELNANIREKPLLQQTTFVLTSPLCLSVGSDVRRERPGVRRARHLCKDMDWNILLSPNMKNILYMLQEKSIIWDFLFHFEYYMNLIILMFHIIAHIYI